MITKKRDMVPSELSEERTSLDTKSIASVRQILQPRPLPPARMATQKSEVSLERASTMKREPSFEVSPPEIATKIDIPA